MIVKRFRYSPFNPIKNNIFYRYGLLQRIGKIVKKIPSLFKASSKTSKFDLMNFLDIRYSNVLHTCHSDPKIEDWMKGLNNETRVSMLSIPGTHNSGTYYCKGITKFCFISQCQSWSVSDQLRAGIRFFDLRVTVKGMSTLVNHKAINFYHLESIFEQVSIFLRELPSEFVILSFQGDNGRVPQQNIKALLRKHHIEAVFTSKIPTVIDLRGKAWIFGGFNVDFQPETFKFYGKLGIQNEQNIYVQNFYALSKEMTISKKSQHVLHTAFHIQSRSDRMKINFLSANIRRFVDFFLGPFPYVLVLEEEGPNFKLNEQLKSRPNSIIGVTVMDFPGYELIERIINSNSFL